MIENVKDWEEMVLHAAKKVIEADLRLVQAKADLAAAQSQYDETRAAYHRLLNELRPASATIAQQTSQSPVLSGNGNHKGSDSLRTRILMYLEGRRGIAVRLHEIEEAVHAENHRKLIWTLSNMQRDGVITHEGRGLWSLEKEDRAREEDDPPF